MTPLGLATQCHSNSHSAQRPGLRRGSTIEGHTCDCHGSKWFLVSLPCRSGSGTVCSNRLTTLVACNPCCEQQPFMNPDLNDKAVAWMICSSHVCILGPHRNHCRTFHTTQNVILQPVQKHHWFKNTRRSFFLRDQSLVFSLNPFKNPTKCGRKNSIWLSYILGVGSKGR